MHQGDETLLFRWADLEGVEFRLAGIARAQASGRVRFAETLLRGLYAALAAVLFVVSLGGLGGAALGQGSTIWTTPFLKGRPRTFAVSYSVPMSWPRQPTELELRWFEVVINKLAGSPGRLDTVGMAGLLDSAAGIREFESRVPEFVA